MLDVKHYSRAMKRPKKNAAAAALGKLGGPARAKALTPEQRTKIARKGARARWGKART